MSGPSPVTVAGAAPDFHRLPFTVPSLPPYGGEAMTSNCGLPSKPP